MIIFIDFSSFGDSGFYLDYWKNSFINSKKKYLLIYHAKSIDVGKSRLGIPIFFCKFPLFQKIYKFIAQTSIIFLMLLISPFFKKKIKIIFNLHQPFIFWLWLVRFISEKIHVSAIIHDIIEFDTSAYPNYIISSNLKIISKLNSVVLHAGIDKFKKIYPSKIFVSYLPFPNRKKYDKKQSIIDGNYFYLPGRYRKEKGFDFVIKNWPDDMDYKLVISTNLPNKLEKFIIKKNNIVYKPSLVSSYEFENLLSNAFACILMYYDGTNSGILETIVSNNIRCLVSDIPMFINNIQSSKFYISKFDKFDFYNKLHELINSPSINYKNYNSENLIKYKKFISSF